MDGIVVSLYLLSVYGASVILAKEDGPFTVFQKARNLYTKADWIGYGLRCPNCVSWWVSLVGAILLAPNFLWFVLLWWGGAGFTRLIVNWGKNGLS